MLSLGELLAGRRKRPPRGGLANSGTDPRIYFGGACAGAAGAGLAGGAAGLAGCDLVVDGLTPENTELAPPDRDAMTDNTIEVTMKIIADQVVAFDKAVAAPRGPNAVWLP